MCAQIKRKRWNVGKKIDALEFDYHAKKKVLMKEATLPKRWGQRGVCMRVSASVAGNSCGVCRPAETQSSSSSSSDTNLHFGMRYKAKRMRRWSRHVSGDEMPTRTLGTKAARRLRGLQWDARAAKFGRILVIVSFLFYITRSKGLLCMNNSTRPDC